MNDQLIRVYDQYNDVEFDLPAEKYLSDLSLDELHSEMQYRISKEEYELCSLIKDKIEALQQND